MIEVFMNASKVVSLCKNSDGIMTVSKNGHNGEGLPGSLAAFMLSHLKIPKQDDPSEASVKNDAAMKVLTSTIGEPNESRAVSYENSYETRTSEPNSEIAAVIKTMKETGCAHEEIREVVAILANKTPPSYDNRTSLVRESDAELKLRRKKEYDRKYHKERYEKRARDPELKILVRENVEPTISLEKNIESEEEVKKEREVSKKESKSTKRAKKIVYPQEFEKFWLSYPRSPTMSKFEALTVWKKIGPEERQLAIDAVPKFVAWLKTQKADYQVIHACRFLSKRRFDGFQSTLAAADFNSEEYQAARRRALDAIKGT